MRIVVHGGRVVGEPELTAVLSEFKRYPVTELLAVPGLGSTTVRMLLHELAPHPRRDDLLSWVVEAPEGHRRRANRLERLLMLSGVEQKLYELAETGGAMFAATTGGAPACPPRAPRPA